MIIPYEVDVPFDRRPWTNYLIIALCVLAFTLEMFYVNNGQAAVKPYVLSTFTARGLFGHIWLHGGIIHIAGNMLFLWDSATPSAQRYPRCSTPLLTSLSAFWRE